MITNIDGSESRIINGVAVQRYKWFKGSATYTNTSSFFIVVVGIAFTAVITQDTTVVSIADASGVVIDRFATGFVTSGLAVEGMFRRMLVPPGGTITSQSNNISLVQCATIDDAMAIL